MPAYTPPLQDMKFVFEELFDGNDISQLPGLDEITPDLVDAVLEEAGKICSDVLQPINLSGDQEGCHFKDGQVTTPKGFKEAYDIFREGGWTGLACHPDHGGQGLPHSVNTIAQEMICSANLSFGMYPGLSHGAYLAINRFATDDLKEKYLPKLCDGTWSGTMCLTEPHSGTDLGLCRTKAVPQDDGSYKITGTKIFISAGEHDLTENIIHLVLARMPDAPDGIKGISLFLVPKLIDGAGNNVSCGSIEHKMGIKASSTCVMNFDEATGWLVGEAHKGMKAMFIMMNAARLAVGVQGLGLAEAAYQGAVTYARERLQGRSLTGTKHPDKPADPIIVHPDVRRMLMTMRCNTEGGRMLASWAGFELDKSHLHPDEQVRKEADDRVQLLTPMVKAYLTDLGFETTNIGVQVFGGHGFISENGMEQLVRDARITQIYEGTNGIQALDLVGRKMPAHTGRYLRRFFHPAAAMVAQYKDDEAMTPFILPFAKALGRLQIATGHIAEKGMGDPEEAAAGATEYLKLFALTVTAYLWCQAVIKSLPRADKPFYRDKLITAQFFMTRILPETGSLLSAIMSGKAAMMDLSEESFERTV